MSIIRFDFERADSAYKRFADGVYPDGCYCTIDGTYSGGHEKRETHGVFMMWEEHVGLCLNDYERNGYDDSDFFMEIWNPAKQCVETICFATTRGWSYPSMGSKPDATPEVRALAQAWREEQKRMNLKIQRDNHAKDKRELRKNLIVLGKKYGFPYYRMSKLFKIAYQTEETQIAILKLMKSNLRSEFRMKLRNQLIDWLKQSEPKYKTPFSYKQLMYV